MRGTRLWGTPRGWLLISIVIVLLFTFFQLTDEVFPDEADERAAVEKREEAFFEWVHALRTDGRTAAAINVTALGSTLILTVVVFYALVVLLMRRDVRGAIILLAGSFGGALGTKILKHTFDRPRPDPINALTAAAGFSYPSGHSMGAAAVYFTLAIIIGRGLRERWQRLLLLAPTLLIVLSVAASRVYLGVHWPTDVAAGVCLGSAWVALVAAAELFLEKHVPAAS